MRFYRRYNFHATIIIFCGLVTACLLDTVIHKHEALIHNWVLVDWLTSEATLIAFMGMVLVLVTLSLFLQNYVKPLSYLGAFMTGFCAFALIAFVVP
ncbi:MAG: hypothetical protein COA69_02545 [Robiginitomaculum sp.]|nr:MAG: hypothetical protein COA69_02545 [Robiginitomaculum sp.]